MEFDFMTPIDRAGTDALAVNLIPVPGAAVQAGYSRIPMWVADMSFAAPDCIPQEIARRTAHPLYGYFELPQAYYDAILQWHRAHNGADAMTQACIGYENGVLGGVVSALEVLCSRGDSVLLHSPTYIGFSHVLENNGYHAEHSPLVQDAQGVWRMDYADMERRLQEKHIHAAILCSPHNPTGRVWERAELEQAMEIFRRNDCFVISDEIWSDLVLDGHRHIPTQLVSEDARRRTVALYAPSKTFNLAGLVGAYHVVYEPWLRDRLEKQSSLCHYNSPNLLAVYALIGAYSAEGGRWLTELRGVLSDNARFACDFIRAHFDGVTAAAPQGTYMLYLDCGGWCRAHGKTLDELLRAGIAVGVIWQDGRPFLRDNTIRLNLALPPVLLHEAFDRLQKHVFCG